MASNLEYRRNSEKKLLNGIKNIGGKTHTKYARTRSGSMQRRLFDAGCKENLRQPGLALTRLQEATGFATHVLTDEKEDVWNDL